MAAYRTLRHLKGRRIAVLAADGFEKIELTMPEAALRLAAREQEAAPVGSSEGTVVRA